jgi:hypothetical protein
MPLMRFFRKITGGRGRFVCGGPLAVCLLLAWFNCGSEHLRRFVDSSPGALWPPWKILQIYVSNDGEEHYYYEYSRLVLGETPDVEYMASKQRGDLAKSRAEFVARVRPGPGLRMPYRDFPLEYPPLPLVLVLLPRLFVDSLPAYRLAYGIVAGLLTLLACFAGVAVSRRLGESAPKLPWRRCAFMVLAIGPILVARLDILPALLVTGAVLLLARERPLLAGLCVGAGAMAKLYPLLVLAPLVMVAWAEGRRRHALRLVAGVGIAAALVAAPFLWAAPAAFLRSSLLYGDRPFEVESIVGATAILLRGKAAIVGSFGSFNVEAPAWLRSVFGILLPASVLGLGGMAAWQARHSRVSSEERLGRLVLWVSATVSVILLTSKVLSPQFLIWLLPLCAIAPGVAVHRWACAAAALTQTFYPNNFGLLVDEGSRVMALIVLARNGALVGLAIAAVRAAAQAHAQPMRDR